MDAVILGTTWVNTPDPPWVDPVFDWDLLLHPYVAGPWVASIVLLCLARRLSPTWRTILIALGVPLLLGMGSGWPPQRLDQAYFALCGWYSPSYDPLYFIGRYRAVLTTASLGTAMGLVWMALRSQRNLTRQVGRGLGYLAVPAAIEWGAVLLFVSTSTRGHVADYLHPCIELAAIAAVVVWERLSSIYLRRHTVPTSPRDNNDHPSRSILVLVVIGMLCTAALAIPPFIESFRELDFFGRHADWWYRSQRSNSIAIAAKGIWLLGSFVACTWLVIDLLLPVRESDSHYCARCGYDLRGTPADGEGVARCPECGASVDVSQWVDVKTEGA